MLDLRWPVQGGLADGPGGLAAGAHALRAMGHHRSRDGVAVRRRRWHLGLGGVLLQAVQLARRQPARWL